MASAEWQFGMMSYKKDHPKCWHLERRSPASLAPRMDRKLFRLFAFSGRSVGYICVCRMECDDTDVNEWHRWHRHLVSYALLTNIVYVKRIPGSFLWLVLHFLQRWKNFTV